MPPPLGPQPPAGFDSPLGGQTLPTPPSAPDLPLVPSFRQFLELPIAVKSHYDSYREVTDALDQLAFAGWYQGAALLADATYTDDRAVATLSTRANGLFSLPMQFRYQGEGEGLAQDPPAVLELKRRVVKVVEDHWEEMFPGATMREMLRWGILLNAGIGELVWRWENDLLLPTLKTWNPQFIYWRWDTRSIWVIHTGGQVELHPGDSRWVYFAPFGHNHGQLYGLIRALGYLWLDRVFTFRNWARAIEKFSLGIIKVSIPADGSVADKAAVVAAVANMPNEATITLPVTEKGNKFDLEMMKTDQSVYSDAFRGRIAQLDASIAILVLGQNLTTEMGGAGGGASGSRAGAKVHDEIRMDIVRADAEVLSSAIKTQALAPFVFFNFAADADRLGIPWQSLVPNVTWDVDPAEDKVLLGQVVAQIAQALQGFQTAGAPVDAKALLEKFGIPILSERRPTTPPPGGGVNERPRLPDLMPTDLPSPDYREYQREHPSGERTESSQYEEPKQAFVGVEGADQFGNPVGPRTDPSGNTILPASPTSGPGTDAAGLYPIASGHMPGARAEAGPASAGGAAGGPALTPRIGATGPGDWPAGYPIQAEAEKPIGNMPGAPNRDKSGNQIASVAAFDDRGRVLIQRRRDSGKWCFPGGHVLPGEDPHVAAQRELAEETGLRGQQFAFLGSRPTSGLMIFLYRCKVFGQPDASSDPDAEPTAFMWLNLARPPKGLVWANEPDAMLDMLRKMPADRYGEHPAAGIPPQGAAPDFRDDKALIAYQDEQRPLWSQFSLARDAPLPDGFRAGQAALDDLVDKVSPQVGHLLAADRRALVELARKARSYDELRAAIRERFKASRPTDLRALLSKAVGIASVLGRESTR